MKLAVVLPAYNVARQLPGVVERIVAVAPAGLFRTLVVDDGSTDDTSRVARELAAANPDVELVSRGKSDGYGAAIKTGLGVARTLGADHVACFPPDGQYGGESLPGLLAALKGQKLDLLQGSRRADGDAKTGAMPLHKSAGKWMLGQLERRIFGLAMTDFHSGYLVYGPAALDRIPFAQLTDRFDFDLEVIAWARGHGLAVGEAAIPAHPVEAPSFRDPVDHSLRILRILWRYQRGRYRG